MSKLLQIIYISRSTFDSTVAVNKIEPNVARILAKSKANNRKNGLVGVLYFGDGIFFQCLEGEEEAVNTLMRKLEADPRHKDIKIISRRPIKKVSFEDWSMKFTPVNEQIGQFLKENGFQSFDPYQFTPAMTEKFLTQLFNANDPTIEIDSSLFTEASSTGIKNNASVTNSLQLKTNLALSFSIVALIVSVVAFLSSRNLL